MSVVDRIQARIVVDANGCHIFQGALDRGYGRVGLGSRSEGIGYTHRIMYAAANGAIPDGLHIDHLCRNRACCNPEHLEAVPQAVNNRRAAEANASPQRGVRLMLHLSARNPWRAEIRVNGRTKHLGLFPTQEAALQARREAELQKSATPERKAAIEAEVTKLGGAA